jgi:hypothetical protein
MLVYLLSFLASLVSSKRQRLRITEEMLLKILTYHQVSPCFLHFISYLGNDPMTGESDPFFGSFYRLRMFSKSASSLVELGRSGRHYQFVFELRVMLRDQMLEEDHDEEEELSLDEYELANLYGKARAVVYHHFDVDNGKSLWIITSTDPHSDETASDGLRDNSSNDIRSAFLTRALSSSSPIQERFENSLRALVWLVDWSMSKYNSYITLMDDVLGDLVSNPDSLLVARLGLISARRIYTPYMSMEMTSKALR